MNQQITITNKDIVGVESNGKNNEAITIYASEFDNDTSVTITMSRSEASYLIKNIQAAIDGELPA